MTRRPRRAATDTNRTPVRGQRGAVAVLVAISLLVLLGMGGLALDLGQMFVAKTELQNAMDACALAASRELRPPPAVLLDLQRAETAGRFVGGRNSVLFQREAVAEAGIAVTFGETLGGAYVAAAAAAGRNVQFVRCTTQRTGIVMWLMHLWGHETENVAATAVASLQGSATACGIPLGMCRKSPPDDCGTNPATGTAYPGPDSFGLCEGKWYSGRFGSGGGETGNFNWLDFEAHGGGSPEIQGALEGPGICNIQVGITQVHAEPGNLGESAGTSWNSRFGLYKQGAGNPSIDTAAPDYSGYAYTEQNWASRRRLANGDLVAADAYADFVTRQNARVSYGPPSDTTQRGNQITGLRVQNSFRTTASGSGPGDTHGNKGQSRRVVAMPVVDCAGWGPTHLTAVSGWACALMLTPYEGPNENIVLEYLGQVGPTNDKCPTYGGPSGTGPKVPTLVQ